MGAFKLRRAPLAHTRPRRSFNGRFYVAMDVFSTPMDTFNASMDGFAVVLRTGFDSRLHDCFYGVGCELRTIVVSSRRVLAQYDAVTKTSS